MLENKKFEIKEEVKEDEDGETLTPSEEEVIPNLSNSPVPTEEQVEEMTEEDPDCEDDDGCCDSGCDHAHEPSMTEEQMAVEKLFNQDQVNEMMGKTRVETRNKTMKGIYDRYGVKDESEMDGIVGKSQMYDTYKEDTDSTIAKMKEELGSLKSTIAMYESNINPERYEDVKAILKGKGKDITVENIQSEINTHPEWRKPEPSFAEKGEMEDVLGEDDVAEGHFKKKPDNKNESSIMVLGNDRPDTNSGRQSERESAMKLFDL